MKKRFMSFVLCCGMVFSTAMPISAAENADIETTIENSSLQETDASVITDVQEVIEDISAAQDGEAFFDVNEADAVCVEEEAAETEIIEETEKTAPTAAEVTDDSMVYKASECLDTTANSNKYWKFYWRSWGNHENYTIDNGFTVAMKTDVNLTSQSQAKRDDALYSRSNWNGRVRDSATTPISAGIYLMTPGGLWSNEFTVSKGFTAPKTGKIEITQENLYNGTNEIWGTSAAHGTQVTITKNSFRNAVYATQKLNSDNGGKIAFAPLTIDVNAGDIVWFDVQTASTSTLESNKFVHWNPVITYKSINPTVLRLSASEADFETARLGQSYSVKFKETLNAIGAENIEITGEMKDGSPLSKTPKVNEVSLNENTVTVSFLGLERAAKYTVTLKNMDFEGLDVSDYTYSFNFTTQETMSLAAYKQSDSFSSTSNNGPIWKYQYRNDDIFFTDLTKSYGSGMSVTINGTSYGVGTGWINHDNWWQGFNIGKTCMIVGNVSGASATASSDRAVRTFIAPSAGFIEISACDPNGDSRIWGAIGSTNNQSAKMVITRTDAGDTSYSTNRQVWPEDGSQEVLIYDTSKPENGTYLDFEPMIIEVQPGDMVHFEAVPHGANWWGMTLYWDPVITYKATRPQALTKNFEENGGTYAPNYEFSITYDDDMAVISASDVSIDGGARVKSVSVEGTDTIRFSFDGIKEKTNYNVKIDGLRYALVNDPAMAVDYQFSFTSGSVVEIGEVKLTAGRIVSGSNEVTAEINNSADVPCDAALLLCVMRGTADDYTVEKIEYVSRSDVGANDTITAKIDIADTTNAFIRVIPVSTARAIVPYGEAVDLR